MSKKKIYNPPFLGAISFVTVAYFLYYLWWRVAYTLNPDYPFFSWILLLAEAFGVFSYVLFAWYTKNVAPTTQFKTPRPGMAVDIFVPTYNEDVEILEATLVGCKRVSYPHTTYVLDDGNRLQVKELAERLGCKYIARPVHDHAKAGNINYALRHTVGDFIVILDADMVPQPDYLDRTLGYFDDEKLALVQLPQEFYNRDSIQHAQNSPAWHEQSLFFRVIQPGKNQSGSAFWCGSPSVVRREALMDAGGVATETITEDIHTSVRLHSRGWKTLFVNEPLAYGIAPQTIKAFLLQRLRWAQGTMQLYRSADSPLWIRGLTWQQRLSYLSSFLAYFEAYQKFILLTIPVFILAFDIFPMKVNAFIFMLHWLPYFAFSYLANQVGGRGVFRYFKTEKYNILKTIIFLQATLTLISRKPLKFQVTPKTVESEDVYAQERKALRGYMVLFGVLIGSVIYALIKILLRGTYLIALEAFVIAAFWASYNAYVIFIAMREVFNKRHDRRQYRFHARIDARVYMEGAGLPFVKANVMDLSTTGVGMELEHGIPENTKNMILRMTIPGMQDIILPIDKLHQQMRRFNGTVFAGASFPQILGPHRERLFEYLFVYLPRIDEEAVYLRYRWSIYQYLRGIYYKWMFRYRTINHGR